MAGLPGLNEPDAAVGDTFNGNEIVEVINAGAGRYAWEKVNEFATVHEMAANEGLANKRAFLAKGRSVIGDGGGQSFIYRSSGKSSIAIDNGFYISGSDSDDYFESVDKLVARSDWFGSSGRGEIATTGSITNGSSTLTVASSSTFEVGQGIAVYGAGTKLGSLAVLVTRITAKSGNTLTLRNAASATVSGAVVEHSDNEAIQECIDAVLYPGHQESQPCMRLLQLGGGVFYCHDSIHLGYGETFKQIHVQGAGNKYSGTWDFTGTALVARFSDRPLLCVNGARSNTVADLHLLGRNRSWVESRGLGGLTGAYADSAVTDWISTTLLAESSNCNSRYAPYAGIAIDPYAGSEPTPAYPDMTIPSWISDQDQYGKSFSSNVEFHNVSAEGFVVGCVVQPSGADGNGDYIHFDNCYLNYNAYGFSAGNAQARLMSFTGGTISNNHTNIATGVHGAQTGKPSFLFTNIELGYCMKVFDLPTLSYGGAPKFDHCYGEAVYRLGDGVVSAANPSSITFDSCEWSFNAAVHGVPRDIIKNSGPTIFRGGSISMTMPSGQESVPHAILFDVPGTLLQFEKTTLVVGSQANTTSLKTMVNGCGGVACRSLSTAIQGDWSIANRWNLISGSASTVTADFTEDTAISNRAHGISIYAKRVRAQLLGNRDQGFSGYSEVTVYDKTTAGLGETTGGISISTSGRTVTISNIYNTRLTTAETFGGAVGDLVLDDVTGTLFVVKAVTLGATATWKLYALTNFTAAGNLNTAITATGNFYAANCRMYTLGNVTKFSFSSSGTDLTNFKRSDGIVNYINDTSSGVAVDDYIAVVQESDYWTSSEGGKITAINNSTGVVGITGAPVYSGDRRRAEYCIRKPSTNE